MKKYFVKKKNFYAESGESAIKTIVNMVLFLLFLLLSVWFLSVNQTVQKVVKYDMHEPTKELREQWGAIEDMLIQKEAETIKTIDLLLFELVEQENDITALLEQKASTQMGSISIVIVIILAMLGFFIKDIPKFLSSKQKNLFLFISFVFFVIFIFSMYWSHQGFVVRGDYAAYNVDDLFEIMKDKDSNLTTFWVSNILENYQIYIINSRINEYKADSLILAARSFIIGIIGFAAISLGLVFITRSNVSLRSERR